MKSSKLTFVKRRSNSLQINKESDEDKATRIGSNIMSARGNIPMNFIETEREPSPPQLLT